MTYAVEDAWEHLSVDGWDVFWLVWDECRSNEVDDGQLLGVKTVQCQPLLWRHLPTPLTTTATEWYFAPCKNGKVLWWACLCVCLSVSIYPELHVRSSPNFCASYTIFLFYNFLCILSCVSYLLCIFVPFWRRCNMLCTSGFMDDENFRLSNMTARLPDANLNSVVKTDRNRKNIHTKKVWELGLNKQQNLHW